MYRGTPCRGCELWKDFGWGGKLGLDVLQVGLPGEFLVEYHTLKTHRRARVDSRGGRGKGAGAVVLCPCFGEMLRDLLLWGKTCPIPPGPLQALLMNSSECSAVLFGQFSKGRCIHILNKASLRSREGRGVVSFDKVGVVEEKWEG